MLGGAPACHRRTALSFSGCLFVYSVRYVVSPYEALCSIMLLMVPCMSDSSAKGVFSLTIPDACMQ